MLGSGLDLGVEKIGRDGEGFRTEQRRYLQGVRRETDARVDGQLRLRTMGGGDRFGLDVGFVLDLGVRDRRDGEGFRTEQRPYLQGIRRETDARVDGQLRSRTEWR